MNTTNVESREWEPVNRYATPAQHHPVRYGIGFAAILVLTIVGISVLPDIMRYIKIRNM